MWLGSTVAIRIFLERNCGASPEVEEILRLLSEHRDAEAYPLFRALMERSYAQRQAKTAARGTTD